MCSARALGPDRRGAPHGLARQALLGEWLKERHRWTVKQTGQITVVVGGHQGVSPEHGHISALQQVRTPAAFPGTKPSRVEAGAGGGPRCMREEYGVWDRLTEWRSVKLPQPVQVLLTALVIAADWVARNADHFPYTPQNVARSSMQRAAAAWRGLDLPTPWCPGEPAWDAQELFASRFDLPPGPKVALWSSAWPARTAPGGPAHSLRARGPGYASRRRHRRRSSLPPSQPGSTPVVGPQVVPTAGRDGIDRVWAAN